jgi:hypothetical protein
MTFDKLADSIKTHAVLMSGTNKDVLSRATVSHVTGKLYAIAISHADARRPVLELGSAEIRIVCRNGLHAR